MPESLRWRCRASALVLALLAGPALAAPELEPGAPLAPANSALDAPLFYQLLIGEMQLRNGDPGTAYQAFLDAARRTKDPTLFRRAMDVALQARAGNEALAATRAWRTAHPKSADPLRLELQILAVLNRLEDARDPLAALMKLTPAGERAGLISALPRILERTPDKRQTAEWLASALVAEVAAAATRSATLVTLGRAWMAAGEADRALALAQEAGEADAGGPGPALLALQLMDQRPEAESLVRRYLARSQIEPSIRLAYVRTLTSRQRYTDAVAQLLTATQERPDDAAPYLTLGALQLELRQFALAETALKRYVALAEKPAAEPPTTPARAADAPESAASASAGHPGAEDDDGHGTQAGAVSDQGLVQAWLMLAQVAEQRGDFAGAEALLGRIDAPQRALEVASQRALMLARRGQVDAGVAALRQVPERQPQDARAKLLAEAQLLREVKLWQAAFKAFETAVQRFPDDVDLLYEQAMVADKINRADEMERLLRRVIELKPDHGHAHNALGYSLADRGLRLTEARELIRRALELRPGDPFITDSLGWVEYRLGRHDEALRHLRTAWAARPDTEIGAHLGEVLWAMGQLDEARKIWRQARARDDGNEVLQETLARLQVGL